MNISRNFIIFWLAIELILLCTPITASSKEECVANYDAANNIVQIPCLTIGEEKIWVNLKLAAPDTLLFEVDGFGAGFLPLWLVQMIDEFKAVPVSNPPRMVMQFQYHEELVYYITSPCCDQFNSLYDLTGTVICAPDGGLTGKGDGQCSDFGENSTNKVVVWQDQRKLNRYSEIPKKLSK